MTDLRLRTALLLLSAALAATAAPTLSGLDGTHRTQSAKTLGNGRLSVGVSGEGSLDENKIANATFYHYEYAYDTVTNEPTANLNDSTEIDELLDITARAFLGIGITNYFDLGVALPIYMDELTGIQAEDDPDLKDISGIGIGDVEIMGKLQYPPYEHDHTFDMALFGMVTLPTGDKNKGFIPKKLWYLPPEDSGTENRFWTARMPSVTLKLLNTLDFSQLNPNVPLVWSLNFGMTATTSKHLDNSFLLSSSLLWEPTDLLGLFLEFSGETRMSKWADGFRIADDPLFASAGFVLNASGGVAFSLALDQRLSRASERTTITVDKEAGPSPSDPQCPNCTGDGRYTTYQVQPSANLGVSATLSWTGFLVPQDKDKDGVYDKEDACPNDKEDRDGFQDYDGCPDPDNDEDGVEDVNDKCPAEAEDLDGYEDEDGCPELDNDSDGIPDQIDKCPMVPEDKNGFQDDDGCPDGDVDTDKDGIADVNDKCPDKPEDIDGFEDSDGCPDLDNDADGIPDDKDRCPNAAETQNGYEDEDGCPDEKPAPKPVLEKKASIVLRGVNFATGSADLTPESLPQLDPVAETLKQWPEAVIEIRGHTDNKGSAKINQKLSQDRAESVVRYLISRGVNPAQLQATGYGSKMPVASNRTAEGREQNRRIEMYRVR